MIWCNSTLQDGEHTPVQPGSLIDAPAAPEEHGQVIERGCELGVLAAVDVFLDRQCAPIEPFCFIGSSSPLADRSQVVQCCSDVDVVRADRPLKHTQRLSEQRFGLVPLTRGIEQRSQGYLIGSHCRVAVTERADTEIHTTAREWQVMRKLWAEDSVRFDGEFFQLDGVSIAPKPVQRPGPPILVGADTLASISRAPELGDHWVASRRHSWSFLQQAPPAYKAGLERNGRPFKGLLIMRDLCMAPSTHEAEHRIKDAYERMYQLYGRWGQPGEDYDLTFDELKRERLIVGTPGEVIEQVMAYRRAFGAEMMWFTVYWPGMKPQWTLETIQMFGERVIPAVKRATPGDVFP